jgi:hypothetical protein
VEKETAMTITLSPDVEAALNERARRLGVSPEALASSILREKLAPPAPPIEPQDEWERRLLELGTDCGVSLSHEALSSEGLYE